MSKKKKKTPEQKKKTKSVLKKAALIATTGGLGAAIVVAKSKKGKQAIAKVKAKVKTGAKKAGSKLEKGLQKAVGKAKDIPFAPLFPFKKIMVDALNRRGVKHTNDLSDIVPKFYHSIVKNNFQTPSDGYFENGNTMVYTDHIDHVDAKSIAGSVTKTGTGGGAINVAAKFATGDIVGGASSLVTEILTYLRRLKDKKDKQQQEKAAGGVVSDPLTPEEEKILGAAEKTAESLQEVAKDEAEKTVANQVKEFIFSWKGGIALVVLVILIIVAVKKHK